MSRSTRINLDGSMSSMLESQMPYKTRMPNQDKLSVLTARLVNEFGSKSQNIKDAFIENPEVYKNLSEEVTQTSMASLIKLLNEKDFNYCYFNDFKKVGKFKMSRKTRTRYNENFSIISNNKSIAENNNIQKMVNSSGYGSNSSGGCYVATLVYGNYDHSQVKVLRRFRDEVLKEFLFGHYFIKFYYKYSPGWVEYLKDKKFANEFIKKCLNQFIKLID